MTILVLGAGCAKCKKQLQNAQAAVEKSGRTDVNVEYITNINQIASYGIAMTPALIIDGEVKSSGKILSEDDILSLIKQ